MHPTLKALVSQLSGCLLSFGLIRLGILPASLWWFVICQATCAAIISLLLHSPHWWLFIHLIFAPAILLAQHLAIHPLWYLSGFMILLLVYWSSFRTRVPLFLTNAATATAITALIPEQRRIHVLDLGAGTGTLLHTLARLRPGSQFTGIETAPALWWIGRHLSRNRPNIVWLHGNFFTLCWQKYDIVYAFLSPAPMTQVWHKALQDMSPGSLLVSNSFPITDVPPDFTLDIPDHRRTRLYGYRIPGNAEIAA